MKITPNVRAIILSGLRNKDVKKTELSIHLGRPKNWATKLFNGTLKTLDDDTVDEICDYLGVSFIEVVEKKQTVSATAVKLSNLMDQDEDIATTITSLAEYLEQATMRRLPYIPTRALVSLGKEITRAAHEDPDKPGKVGRIAVVWIAKHLETTNKAG